MKIKQITNPDNNMWRSADPPQRAERVAARIGGGGLNVIDQEHGLSDKSGSVFKQSLRQINDRILENNDIECIANGLSSNDKLTIDMNEVPERLQAKLRVNYSEFRHTIADAQNIHHNEPDVYFYHSDHLGSASWITDNGGLAVQHLQYLPYGERYVDQRAAGYHERFTFTGKEKDSLRLNLQSGELCRARLTSPPDLFTSYYYFGARYYDSDLSGLFLSVDPLADKYPSLSPYAYCAWNPVKYLDTDGRTIWLGEYDGTSQKRYDPNEKYAKGTLGYFLNNKYHGSKAGKFVINSLIISESNYFISDSRNPEEKNPCFDASNTQIFLNSNDYGRNEGTLSHELFHAFQHKEGQYNQSMDCEVEAFVFEGIVLTQLNGGKLPTANQMSKGMFNAFTPVDRFNDMHKLYGSNMVSLIKLFNKGKMNYVVNNFSTFSISG